MEGHSKWKKGQWLILHWRTLHTPQTHWIKNKSSTKILNLSQDGFIWWNCRTVFTSPQYKKQLILLHIDFCYSQWNNTCTEYLQKSKPFHTVRSGVIFHLIVKWLMLSLALQSPWAPSRNCWRKKGKPPLLSPNGRKICDLLEPLSHIIGIAIIYLQYFR